MSAKLLRIAYGDDEIAFHLVRRERKTLAITVEPNLSVHVVAPLDAPLGKVYDRVAKRARWIRTKLRFFEQFLPRTPARKFIAGETHRYLGRQYRLKIEREEAQRVRLSHGRIVVGSREPASADATKALVREWLRERAAIKFRERLLACQKRFPDPGEFMPQGITVRQMSLRWGSMTASGRLILNTSLIQASTDTIDYVITHELCHLRHANHGPEFYHLLDRVMPDWEARKLKLERQLA